MQYEVIKSIGDAEIAAREVRLNAQVHAKSLIAEAEKKGQAAVLDAAARAEAEVKKLLDEAEQKAVAAVAELQKATAEKQAEIRCLAESRMRDAAGIIVERIVNG